MAATGLPGIDYQGALRPADSAFSEDGEMTVDDDNEFVYLR